MTSRSSFRGRGQIEITRHAPGRLPPADVIALGRSVRVGALVGEPGHVPQRRHALRGEPVRAGSYEWSPSVIARRIVLRFVRRSS